ncbi:hypothetical protein Y032_0050g1989 [Ancylostoma ceylanicum]|nr:hypothetical protein Y032_0050g1989 [Ancylostoma ceylanicum]
MLQRQLDCGELNLCNSGNNGMGATFLLEWSASMNFAMVKYKKITVTTCSLPNDLLQSLLRCDGFCKIAAKMRGRTFPILNSASLQNASSYVQINIYDTSLKALRKRGVDVKHFLQHVGCRSVVMDVPIVSSEVRKSSRLAGRRLNKSFGGFTVHAEELLTNEVQSSSENVDSQDQHDIHDMSLNNVQELTLEQVEASRATFHESIMDEVIRGPLTSTPLVAKKADSFRSFLSARGTLDDAPTDSIGNDSKNGLTIDKHVQLPSEKSVVGPAAAESSFARFSATVVKGMKTVNDDDISCAGAASFCAADGGAEEYPNEDEDAAQFCDPVDNYEDSFINSEEHVKNSAGSATRTAPDSSKLHDTDLIAKSSSAAVDDESAVEEPSRRGILDNDFAHSHVVSADGDGKEREVAACKNSSSNTRKVNRRKRVRPVSPQDECHKENAGGNCGTKDGFIDEERTCVSRLTEAKSLSGVALTSADQSYTCQFPYCNTTLLWRPRYGKNRLVDHVRLHWGKEVKQCKLCDFKAACFRKIRHHHQMLHSDVAYQGSLSIETKEDIKELVELWKKCFPNSTYNLGWLFKKLQDREWLSS